MSAVPTFAYAKDRIGALKAERPRRRAVNKAGCLGRCDNGPVMVVYPEETWYSFIDNEDVENHSGTPDRRQGRRAFEDLRRLRPQKIS